MKRNRKEFPMGTRENKCQSYKKLWKIGEMCRQVHITSSFKCYSGTSKFVFDI